MKKRDMIKWFSRGAFTDNPFSKQDVYREFEPTFRGGQRPTSGPSSHAPQTTTAMGIQLGPWDMSDNNKVPYELVRLKTDNIRMGSLIVNVRDIIFSTGLTFSVLLCEIAIFGWNGGVKQLVKRAQSNRSNGPVRWVWEQGEQYDSLSIESFYLRAGIEPGQPGQVGVLDDRAIVTATFRYITTHPVTPGYDIVMGG